MAYEAFLTPAAAEAVQRDVASRVRIPAAAEAFPTTAAGLDVSYAIGSDQIAAAVVVVEISTGRVLEEVVVPGRATFPYIPGLLAFREIDVLQEALERLTVRPDLLVCDGQGIAHPHRCGLASHLGVLTGLLSLGCAKSHFVGRFTEPGSRRGDRSPLVDAGEVVGNVLRTQDGVRPVFVSPGHLVAVEQAADLVLALTSRYRLADPVRRADHLSRQDLKGLGVTDS